MRVPPWSEALAPRSRELVAAIEARRGGSLLNLDRMLLWSEPLAPVLGNVVAPLAPVVDDLVAPLAPVIDNLTAPLSPVVDGVVTALPPAVADILSPRAPQPESGAAPLPSPSAPLRSAPAPATAPVPPSHFLDTPATPQQSPSSIELPATHQPGVDPQAGSPAHSHAAAGYAAFSTAPAFPTPLQSLLPAGDPEIAPSQTDAPAQGAPSQTQTLPAPSGSSAAAGAGSGVAAALLFALLVSLAAFGLRHSTRLRLPSKAWRQQAFLAVIERPG